MKLKHVLLTAGLASFMALGVGAALSHRGSLKQAKAEGEKLYASASTIKGLYEGSLDLGATYDSVKEEFAAELELDLGDKLTFTCDGGVFYGNLGYPEIDETYGNKDLWSNPNLNYMSPKSAGTYHLYINSQSKIYTTLDDCLIRGTVGELGELGEGLSIGSFNGSQYEITNLHLTTEDSFKFYAGQFGKEMSYANIEATYGHIELWNEVGGKISPRENGYYNFYIQEGNIYTTKTVTEDVDDGVYIVGSASGWEATPENKMTQNGAVYLLNRRFAKNEELKAKSYVDGLGTWLQIQNVVYKEESFKAVKDGDNVRVNADGRYTLRVYLSSATLYTYAFTDEATEWADKVNGSMVCYNGESAPTFTGGYSWSIYADLYAALEDESKDFLKGLEGKEDGTSCERVVWKYDLIMAHKYAGFDPFIVDSKDAARGTNLTTNPLALNKNTTTALIVIISSISLVAVSGLVILTIRKRKHQ